LLGCTAKLDVVSGFVHRPARHLIARALCIELFAKSSIRSAVHGAVRRSDYDEKSYKKNYDCNAHVATRLVKTGHVPAMIERYLRCSSSWVRDLSSCAA
jgi:hypothetical protein